MALLGLVSLLGLCGLGGCTSSTASGDGTATSDDEVRELDADRSSPMLDRLRNSNRGAARSDREQDLDEMRRELTTVEAEINAAKAAGKETVSLVARRDNLQTTIAHEERMLRAIEEGNAR